jgi:uncharacterized protein (DUF1330 family)
MHLKPTAEAGKALFERNLKGPVVMLNMLKFKEIADYSASPELAPAQPISGQEAYKKYMKDTKKYLEEAGGEVIFMGKSGQFLIGPEAASWDAVLLVKYQSVETFLAMIFDEGYLAGTPHRIAALEDSRLLPTEEGVIY